MIIQVIGFALNSSIINYGLKVFDGGAGLEVFLFSSVYSLGLWFIAFKLTNR